MIENEMDNLGSKSNLFKLVKEQRVNDDCLENNNTFSELRYTLTDCENSYQVNVLSKQTLTYFSFLLFLFTQIQPLTSFRFF